MCVFSDFRIFVFTKLSKLEGKGKKRPSEGHTARKQSKKARQGGNPLSARSVIANGTCTIVK